MKKIVSFSVILLLLLSICIIPSFAAEKPLLVDDAGLLNEAEAAEVSSKLKEVSDDMNMDIVIVTTKDLGGKSKTAFADDYFDYNGYGNGRKGDRSGVLLLVYDNGTTTERWMSTSGDAVNGFTDEEQSKVGQELAPMMNSGQWKASFIRYADLMAQNADRNVNVFLGIIIALVVGIIAGFIAIGIVKKKYKPVQFKANASDYLVNGSLQVTGAYDNFRTTSVTKTAIQSNSGSSSSHTSSSGRSHGGSGF